MPFGSDDGRTKNLKEKEKDKDLNLTFVSPETKRVVRSEEQRRTTRDEECFEPKSFGIQQNGHENTRKLVVNSDLRSQTARDR